MEIDYAVKTTPPEYKCSKCGKGNRKLWRYGNTFCVELHCKKCAEKDQGQNERGYEIGAYVPAVPCDVGYYWVPIPYVPFQWWLNLPNG